MNYLEANCQDCSFSASTAEYDRLSDAEKQDFTGPLGYVWQVSDWHAYHTGDDGRSFHQVRFKPGGMLLIQMQPLVAFLELGKIPAGIGYA